MAKPSDSELLLLKPLWEHGQLSAREIHDETAGVTEWSPSATRKTLDRMVDKGLLKTRSVHGVKVFQPTRSKVETLANLIRRFTRTVLDTDAPLPAAALTGSKLLSESDIEELEAILAADDDDAGETAKETGEPS